MLVPDSALQKDIELALPVVRAAAGPKCEKLLPAPPGKDFIAFFGGIKPTLSADKLQKALTVGMQNVQREALVAKLDDEQKATLESCTGRWAGTLVTAIPSERAFQLSSEASRQAFRLRLGASPINDLPARCVCAEPPTSSQIFYRTARKRHRVSGQPARTAARQSDAQQPCIRAARKTTAVYPGSPQDKSASRRSQADA